MKNDVKKKRKKKFSLAKLVRNNEFILIMSLLISFVIWINLSLSDNNEATTTISNIPVQVELSKEATKSGLEIFSGNEQFASVTVTGNRVVLGNLTPDDIIVTAENSTTITTTGTYPLSLTARKVDNIDNFQITSTVSPSVITVYVDKGDKAKFELENKITYNVAEGYHCSVSLSSEKITIEGPETEVSKVKSVAIEGNIGGELKDTKELDCQVKLYDYNDNVYTNNMITLSTERVTAVFKVEPTKEIPLAIQYKNEPKDIDLTNFVTIEPKSVFIAAPENVLGTLNSVLTEEVDFANLKNKRTVLNLEIDVPKKCTNLSEISTVKAVFDFRSFSSKKLSVSTFSVKNLSDEYNCDITTENLDITLIGEKENLRNIKASDISCIIDASTVKDTTGSLSLPVEFVINNDTKSWVYGTYTANVSVSKK